MTYLEYYNSTLAPKLQSIDLFLKTEESDEYTIDTVSELLNLSMDEIETIMQHANMKVINRLSFFIIMQNGSSEICKMFSRELQRKLPATYTYFDISYIYQIPYDVVKEAAEEANIHDITTDNINTLFSYIYIRPEAS